MDNKQPAPPNLTVRRHYRAARKFRPLPPFHTWRQHAVQLPQADL